MLKPISEVLLSSDSLLFDGAIGTTLYAKGIFINRCFEDANLSNANLVKDVHAQYLAAGSQVLTTNSFGANHFKLRAHNLHDKTRLINLQAAILAKDAAQGQAYVAGSIGPLGVRIEPWGPTSFDEAKQAFTEQARGLIEGGVDLVCLETFSDISEIQQAILAVRDLAPNMPIFAHLVINPDGHTPLGTPIEWAIQKLDEWNVDVVGLNCSVGPLPMLAAISKIRSVTSKPISMQPNAGLPKEVDGRQIYMSTPEYFAEFAKNFLQAGVRFVGGCCGTSSEHIRAMANTLRFHQATNAGSNFTPSTQVKSTNTVINTPSHPVIPLEQKSFWSKKIALGQKVTSVELLPPPGVSPEGIINKSKILKQAGVDAINIPDGPRASARMSAILTSVMVEQRAEIECVLHYTCRDRNLLSMQSDILGAHAIGLRNLLLITGDPPKLGDYPNATGVFDVDAIGLTNMVHRLNSGYDLGGRPIGEPTAISIGVGVNPVHRDFEYEMGRFKYKVDAGAEWAITQPVFDAKAMFKFMEYLDKAGIKIPIIAGVWPLLSYRNAIFMNNEVPGVVIPDPIMKRMEKVASPEDAKREGVSIAKEMMEQIAPYVAGFQVSAPFGRIDLALDTLGLSGS